jgi:hypothetical protein
MATNPFNTLNDDPANFSLSPDTSYLRPNIAVPTVTLGRSGATVKANADTRLEDVLPSGTTATGEPDPNTVAG